ncbi:DUF5615 family PIN-like protein [Bradyrhizobium sp. BR 1432]|uniref:DUF5615 family PIN-like protein n=1 Tax=Bradyrhizobium sp. BR 1432 TaxID=3447966 RepID=UPI003EE6ED8E
MLYVAEFAASLSDVEVIVLASREGRLLLTADKDFGELVFRRGQAVPGLILLRIDPENGPLVRKRLLEAVDKFGQGLFGRYVVIDEVRFRSRKSPQFADMNIDIDIDVADASLSGPM